MKNFVRNYFSSVPQGVRLFLWIFILGFPIGWIGLRTELFDLYSWFALAPALVWKAQVWRLVTYAFLSAGPLDWAISLFWLVTLVSVVGRNWTAREFWAYCLTGALAGGLFISVLRPGMEIGVWGSPAMIFALLVAWDWMYRHERIVLLGIGEFSVRQTAILIAVINSLVLFFGSGWFMMLAMWCGGLAGWLWLTVRTKLLMGKTPQQVRSERMSRLEL